MKLFQDLAYETIFVYDDFRFIFYPIEFGYGLRGAFGKRRPVHTEDARRMTPSFIQHLLRNMMVHKIVERLAQLATHPHVSYVRRYEEWSLNWTGNRLNQYQNFLGI